MVIYLDKEFRCYTVENGNTIQSIETNKFDGKCIAFIEGHRYIPAGQSWTRNDGHIFCGESIFPIKDNFILESIQKLFEESNKIQADTDAMLIDYEYRLTLLELGITE